MGIIITSANETAILKYWKVLNAVNLVLIPTVAVTWLFTPFITRDIQKNGVHLFFRIFSVSYGIMGTGAILYSSAELTKLKPKIDALNKREQAEFKQSLASDLYVTQSTNTAIAQFLVGERQAELTPTVEPLEQAYSEEFDQFDESNEPVERTSSIVRRTNRTIERTVEPNELSREAEAYLEDVQEALEDELTDSKIIKEVMGFRSEKYKQGKAILEEIKKHLEAMEAEE